MALMLAICSPQPNWMPKKPKLMFHICQKLRLGLRKCWMRLAAGAATAPGGMASAVSMAGTVPGTVSDGFMAVLLWSLLKDACPECVERNKWDGCTFGL